MLWFWVCEGARNLTNCPQCFGHEPVLFNNHWNRTDKNKHLSAFARYQNVVKLSCLCYFGPDWSSIWRKNLVFPINCFCHPKRTWHSEWWRHGCNTHLLPYPLRSPINSKCLISAWAIIKEAIQKHERILLLSSHGSSCAAFCPNAWMKSLHANDQGAKCPWGVRLIAFFGPLAAKGVVPPAPVPWAGYEYELGEGLVLQCRASVWLWGCWQNRQVLWWICVLHLGKSWSPSACQVLFSAGLVPVPLGISADLLIQVACILLLQFIHFDI